MSIKKLILFCVGLMASVAAYAGPVMLNAKLDSATMLMGTRTHLRLELVQDKGQKGIFPLFEQFGPDGYVTLLNDTIELGADMKVDTLEVGSGRIQVNFDVPLQVFDPGVYKLPPFAYVAGTDTVKSQSLTLTVSPVPGVTAETPIAPYTDVAEPEGASALDKVPDAVYNYWWAYTLAILALVAGFILWRMYAARGSLLPSKPARPPYEEAIDRLKRLKMKKLWEMGHEKAYYTELTEILRRYLYGRFGIRAMEMTTNEIMSHLADISNHDIPRDKMREILDMADFVKFAMVRPLPDDNEVLYKNAVDFVESTKPTPVANAEDADKDKQNLSGAGNSTNVGRRGRNARNLNPPKMKSEDRMKVGGQKRKGKRGDVSKRNIADINDRKEASK